MKKIIAALLALLMIISFASCSSGKSDSLSNLTESQTAALEAAGIDPADLEGRSKEEIQAILAEIGVVLENKDNNQSEQNKPQKITADDVENGGSYKVTVGDSMMWNTFTLYYENGKLVKIETSFQKNDLEEPWVETYEGANVENYKFNDIDFYNLTPKDLIDALNNDGYTNTYIEKN